MSLDESLTINNEDMKNSLIIVLTGLMLCATTSCIGDMYVIRGNGVSETEVRDADNFFKVENTTAADVIYNKSETPGITITADENIIDFIITETYNNTLVIKTRDWNTHLSFRVKPVITITSPRVEQVILSGSGAFLADELTGTGVNVKMSGSGSLSVTKTTFTTLGVILSGSGNVTLQNCSGNESDINISGSGSVMASGSGNKGNLKISGSGDIFADNLVLKTASATISGSGNCHTNITEALTGVISGSGNIYVTGSPVINQSISGSGRIIKYH